MATYNLVAILNLRGHLHSRFGPGLSVLESTVGSIRDVRSAFVEVLDEDYYRKGIEINKTLADNPSSLAPATQARNHAATGVKATR